MAQRTRPLGTQMLVMYSWTCTCGRGGASRTDTLEAARLEADVHVCRAGRLRAAHAVIVRADATEA